MKFIMFIALLASVIGNGLQAQTKDVWNNKKCAVCLTYDDGLNVDLDNVIPLLDSLGFKGTFYVPGNSPSLDRRLGEWRTAARNGHELGNHTLFHPCDGTKPGRTWVSRDYDLSRYTVTRMTDEIKEANTLLNAIDGKTERTFAYPCGETMAGDSSYVDEIRKDFAAARGVQSGIERISDIDVYNAKCYIVNGQTGDELVAQVRKAVESGGLLVFLFHGVGGEHAINVSLDAHRQLMEYLKQNEDKVWIASFIDVMKHVKEYGKK